MRGAEVRVRRGKDAIFTGKIDTLRHIKDDVREVAQGYECGVTMQDFIDVQGRRHPGMLRDEASCRASKFSDSRTHKLICAFVNYKIYAYWNPYHCPASPRYRSLKDKRQIIKSVMETTRRKFNISIAEVDDLDTWRRATLGMACVANDGQHVNRVLDKVLDTLESNPLLDVGEVAMEML